VQKVELYGVQQGGTRSVSYLNRLSVLVSVGLCLEIVEFTSRPELDVIGHDAVALCRLAVVYRVVKEDEGFSL
jgi:hypothetical protein